MAVKMIEKRLLVKENKKQYAITERDILTMCDSPYIIKLYTTFQDADYLCMFQIGRVAFWEAIPNFNFRLLFGIGNQW